MMELLNWRDGLAGSLAGAGSVLGLHPLDVVKTRLQVQDGYNKTPEYHGTLHCMKSMVHKEGWLSLYSGLLPTLIGSGVSWGMYFWLYNGAKSSWLEASAKDELSATQHLICGMEAGLAVTLATNPLWVLKTRFQLQSQEKSNGITGKHHSNSKSSYRGILHGVKTIWKQEGLTGFYKGFGTSILLVSHGAVQFMIYEELRSLSDSLKKQDSTNIPAMYALSIGAISKFGASLITYPLQVARSRLQQRFDINGKIRYTSTRQALSQTFINEGWGGLYKGLGPCLLRVMPQAALTFMLYEKFSQLFRLF